MEHPAFTLVDEQVEQHVPGRLDEKTFGANKLSAQKAATLRDARVGQHELCLGPPIGGGIGALQGEGEGAASGRIIDDYP